MTITEESPETTLEVGRPRLRKEDQRLITGRTRFTDNLSVHGMLFLGMVRSPIARILDSGIASVLMPAGSPPGA